jgi:hypothetical protein
MIAVALPALPARAYRGGALFLRQMLDGNFAPYEPAKPGRAQSYRNLMYS